MHRPIYAMEVAGSIDGDLLVESAVGVFLHYEVVILRKTGFSANMLI